jgi:hypothetical protein
MTYETLRNYFSVNKAGRLSILYKFLLACLWPLQQQWNTFELWRQKIWLISQCKWQIGQLTNVLNTLYDPISKRIFTTQAEAGYIFAPTIDYESDLFAPTIAVESTEFAPTILDSTLLRETIINIPSIISGDDSVYSDFIATIEKIRILGLLYTIQII